MREEQKPTLSSDRETIQGNLILLRQYARRMVTQGDEPSNSEEAIKAELLSEYLAQGKSLKLTERDLVLLLFKGIIH